jgi:hypothetical protein
VRCAVKKAQKFVALSIQVIWWRVKCAFFTLYEKSYHLGVGALINSLIRAEFSGSIFVGYRDELPHGEISSKATGLTLSGSRVRDPLFQM